jgi:hypothetical protein
MACCWKASQKIAIKPFSHTARGQQTVSRVFPDAALA